MAQSAKFDTELMTEHFGYPPVSLLDDIINSINILAERALNSVEQGLLNTRPASLGFRPIASKSKPKSRSKGDEQQDETPQSFEETARHEIENGTHQLETLLCASIDRNFDKFELYVMRNILCVGPEARDWIRLGHYEGLDFTGLVPPHDESHGGVKTDDSDRPTVESVHRLRRRLQASQQLNVMLHAERAHNEALLGELRALVGGVNSSSSGKAYPAATALKNEEAETAASEATVTSAAFGFLQSTGDLAAGDAETPLTTTTAFALSQLQALRALSTSLRSLQPDLEEPPGADPNLAPKEEDDDEPGRKSWRRERLEYVDGATRRHLENVRGLELGRDGEVRDGEWQGEGRNLARGEVEGLEKVVAILGGGASAAQQGGGDKMDES